MNKKVKTIAFQVDDWDFLKEYDRRQQESGLSVKNYFISLIKADIALNQTQKDSPVQDTDIQTDASVPEQAVGISSRQAEEVPAPEQIIEPVSQQDQPDAPEEMMNLFIKIPKDHRIALDAHKNATDETVNKVINRIVDDFLDHTDSLPEGFDEVYQRYSEYPKLCDTTASAKIPARINQELTEYLAGFGGSRNALMATLVELELKGQELVETQNEDQGMNMI